jgi:tetratricopeptide (TPR) repeat protein
MILAPFLLILNYQTVKLDKAYNYHNLKADYYFHKGNYSEMLYHLKEKVKIDPTDMPTWSDIGYYYWSLSVDDKKRSQEFKDKALSNLMQGLNFNKTSYYMWDEIARFHVNKSKDFKAAIPFLVESTKRKDCTQASYHLLAMCYESNNDFENCKDVLKKCLEKFPDDRKALSKLNYLMRD